MNIHYTTGNKAVDAVGEMNLTGNIIPEAWYRTITKNGKPCSLAILLLADIVYWYRPTEHRDETTQNVIYKKKFRDENYLQRSYEQITEKFGISKKQARDALITLEELGVVKRHFRTITVSGMRHSNVMYLELNPDILKMLTYPNEDPIYKNVTTPLSKRNDHITELASPYDEKVETYTKTTKEINSETSTSALDENPHDIYKKTTSTVVDEAKDVFSDLGLPDKDIKAIVMASGNDINKCKNAKQVLEQQTIRIGNITGWLISAVKKDYRPLSKPPSVTSNSFLKFQQREYTDEQWSDFERELLALSI